MRSVRAAEQTESHRLIEHLMIAANEQVATAARRSAASRRSTGSTRSPTRERVERLVAQLASLEVPTPPLPEHLVALAGG